MSSPRPLLLFLLVITGLMACESEQSAPQTAFTSDLDRTWIGPDFWANRLQDWSINNGRIETTQQAADKPLRTLHLLTRRVGPQEGTLRMQVETGWLEAETMTEQAEVGFLIGAGRTMDYRAAALIHHSPGPGAGIFAGMDRKGNLFIRNIGESPENIVFLPTNAAAINTATLSVDIASEPEGYKITIARFGSDGTTAEQTLELPNLTSQDIEGNVALVSSYDRAWFSDWVIEGNKFDSFPDRTAGPVLGTQYTLSRQTMKMTAQLMPIGDQDSQQATLEIMENGQWQPIATEPVVVPGYTATFRVTDWNDTQDIPYRVAYDMKTASPAQTYYWEGTIRKDPVDQPVVSVAGFTGNHNTARGVEQGGFAWWERVWFPHTDITSNVAQQDVDVLFFSGDQVYEGASPTFPDRGQRPPGLPL